MTTSTVGRPSVGWMATGMPRPLSTTRTPPSGEQRDLDVVAVAGEGLVDGVVDDLVDQVVQAALTGGADVHAGALAHRLEPLEHRDRAGVVPAVAVLEVFVVLDGVVLCSATGGGAPQALTRDGGRRPNFTGSDHSMTLEFQAQMRQE